MVLVPYNPPAATVAPVTHPATQLMNKALVLFRTPPALDVDVTAARRVERDRLLHTPVVVLDTNDAYLVLFFVMPAVSVELPL